MSKKRSESPYFGAMRFATKQVRLCEELHGQKLNADFRKAIVKRIQAAYLMGSDQSQRAERSRRKRQTAIATAARANAAAKRHKSIAADFRRRPKRGGIEARLAATAKKMGVSVGTVRTAVKRYP
jgi:hypothetical protein